MLFTVLEITEANGDKSLTVDWNDDLYPALAEVSPEGEFTDRVIDLAEELMGEIDGDTEAHD